MRLTHLLLTLLLLASRAHAAAARGSGERFSPLRASAVPARVKSRVRPGSAERGTPSSSSCAAAPARPAFISPRLDCFMNIEGGGGGRGGHEKVGHGRWREPSWEAGCQKSGVAQGNPPQLLPRVGSLTHRCLPARASRLVRAAEFPSSLAQARSF